ncbi:MAG: response regulator [Myxococcaceae bacterium]
MAAPRGTVLIVEDDPALRRLVAGYLGVLGFETLEAADGGSAIRLLGKAPALRLVCLDLMLPESSGYEVCEFIRQTEALKHLPVLMMSARTLPEDRAHAEEVGVSSYLIKPFTRAEFSRQVESVLGQAGTA